MPYKDIIKNIRSKWMEGSGSQADIVISSRVRLARNLKGLPFPQHLDEKNAESVLAKVKQAVESDAKKLFPTLDFTRLTELDRLQKAILVEKHLISPSLLEHNNYGAVVLDEEEQLSIMVNEEDHLRIQCLLPASQLHEAWRKTDAVDNSLEKTLDFAFDEKFGYVTACPTNVGTGMRASVMLHLPGLVMTKRAGKLFSALSQVGLAVRGLYGEGTEAMGNLFQISNQITMGRAEEEIINNLSGISEKIAAQEREARSMLNKELGVALEDRVWKAYGTLRYARLMSSEKALSLLSQVRLGMDLNIINGLDPRVITELMVMIQPACLQKIMGQEMDADMRDLYRARLLRERVIINNT